MLKPETEQSLNALFEKIVDAYVSVASDAVVDTFDSDDYNYAVSRIMSETEEWKKELFEIINDKR